VRQETSENAGGRHLSGRSDPVLHQLDMARERWMTKRSLSALRRDLLDVLRRLEVEDDTERIASVARRRN
jgi:hypothetical protein